MTKSYVALIRKDATTDYWVDIPDVPGCASCGDTPEEAIASFEEALHFHLQGMKEAGLFLPEPRSIRDVLHDEADLYVETYMIEIDDMTPDLKFRFSRLAGA